MQAATPSTPSGSVLLLIGAGGHGRVVADAALLQGRWEQVHATDDDASRCHGELLPGVPMTAEMLSRITSQASPVQGVHVSIGANAARERVAGLHGHGRLASVRHPDATVSARATLDAGCFVAARAVIAPGAHVGIGAIINHAAVLDHDAVAGDFSHVAPGAVMGGGARIGARVLLGAGAVVLPGVSIANDIVIGAGCVVTHSLRDAGTYLGVPARRVK
jgi:sugar O-acyltransferase (sialic acid O-acetyltransferase NeuD family)